MRSKPKTKRRTLATLAQATIVLTLILAPTAHAGTYVINDCPSAPVSSGNPGPWTVFGSPQNAKGSCSGGTGDYIGPRGATMGPGSSDGVEASVPSESGITLREAEIWWAVPHQTSGADTFAAVRAINGSSSAYLGEADTPFGTQAPDHYVLPSTTTGLQIEDYCSADDGAQGCTLGGGESTDLQLFGAQLTLADSTLPTASVTGGGLTQSTTLTGIQTFTYSATDTSSGVRLVKLLIDGNPVAVNDYIAQCPYQDFLACPAAVSDTITWNTANVNDGQHALQAIVEDAAHNTRVFYSATITTENSHTNETSSTLTSQPATGPGSPNGSNASEAAVLHLNAPHIITRPFPHRALTITGRLTDNQGHPIAGATLDTNQRYAGYTTSLPLKTTTTKPDGTFTITTPPGPSRAIQVNYRAFSRDPSYAASDSITETVNASVQLKITPRHTNPAGTIVLQGKVQGPIPPQGTIVELLVHYLGHWEPFRTPITDKHGNFKVRYQFQGGLGRFPFRAEIPAGQAGFPYTRGYSHTIDINTR
jgi:hypothetical protein